MKEVLILYLKKRPIKYGLIIGFIVSLVVFNSFISSEAQPVPKEQEPPMTTYIPKGYVLIPLQVSEFQNLDQTLGNYGIIDLYTKVGQRTRLIAKAVRALRAPGDPNEIGILVPEDGAHQILSTHGPYYVSIHNPKQSGTQIVKPKTQSKRLIVEEPSP